MPDSKFLQMVRGAIAIQGIPKKSLARKCKVSRPQFSEIIWGDREIPEHIKARLIQELGLENADFEQAMASLGLEIRPGGIHHGN